MEKQRYITTWRRLDRPLDWDYHVSEDFAGSQRVVANIKAGGVRQFHTFKLGEEVDGLSSEQPW